jgi:glycosyl transferase family 7 (putative galactosyltransferase)
VPNRRYSARQKLGVILLDLPRYLWALRPALMAGREPPPWIYVKNRRERLVGPDRGDGVACAWQWTSELHAPLVFPVLGRLLLRAALRDCPIRIPSPGVSPAPSERPDVTFLVGHRGRDRLPHLMWTLRSIAGQTGVSLECIVVEQDSEQTARDHIPGWVRYVHTPLPYKGMPYCRAWVFNVGARQARSPLLVLHDNDMLVPETYAAELVRKHRRGYEITNLKRLIFYLSGDHTRELLIGDASFASRPPDSIIQNLEAGGSIAVDRDAYLTLGGMDEAFVGWGGEDNEFWERALTRQVWPFGYLPIVHLWHPPQPGKGAVDGRGATTVELSKRRASIPVHDRIEELRSRDFGNPRRLDPAPLAGVGFRLAADRVE